jgi:4-diphosphocytidyl-2-C-methyl-D-erythritol kinase
VDTISLTSCAKVNLGLRVLKKRTDGFHEIVSILQAVDLCDTVEITGRPEPAVEVCCDHPEVPSGPENLAHRAARLVQKKISGEQGCRILIRKRIPPGAGLGGGSSNAAAALIGLNRLWRLSLSEHDLSRMAARLGSDVPFFLRGGTALVRGRGELLSPLKMGAGFHLVVVKPDLSISTAWAYGQVKIPLTSNSKFVKLNSLKEIRSLDQVLPLLDNDLERAVGNAYPLIAEIKADLVSKGAIAAAMSGSGSAVYGIVETPKAAQQLAQRMRRDRWQVFVVRPIRGCITSG